ncbi:MAG: GIY-YIG nuclease family protein [Candidatus Omnitrophota bacterium]
MQNSIFYIYLLRSQKDKKLYTGFTNNLNRRVQEHNSGLVASTKSRRPFELIYLEGYKSEKDARDRERSLKLRSRALTQLNRRISDSLS